MKKLAISAIVLLATFGVAQADPVTQTNPKVLSIAQMDDVTAAGWRKINFARVTQVAVAVSSAKAVAYGGDANATSVAVANNTSKIEQRN